MTAPLLRAQTARFSTLDPLLPAAVAPPPGDLITAALRDGERVAGMITKTTLDPGSPQTLWSAGHVWELHPMVGSTGGAGVDALLRRWPSIVANLSPGPDSACLVTWPSRDVTATAALLAHGFVPLAVLAVRTGGPAPAGDDPTAVVRRATLGDLDALVISAMAEVEYSTLVGGAVLRAGASNIKRETLRRHLAQGDPVWIAEVDGIAVGHVEGWHTESVPGSWAETRVRHGRWGYVNCLSVLPHARGTGVGRALMDVAHAELLKPDAVGSFLYYNPPNPVSPVFWARQGYRPLWTVWETRPASAVR
ncbi:GNAT family N-acetyltransferase [Actinokineospora globicatena]|uniref:GNAT family N-acetyltransferase n=1 Tax=Actinokineospora globicatena TaxID=103729 RepID=UPI0020A5F2D8|nr:GNAT family N-acetyltransferase [Actinokineospora globicatena]MCP2304615.1 Acetyltransferase (GNAT) family protein [Actinokineospora globicatena]GLW78013.1 GNAT family N-acetyltransferase [Actinokineospora globicatena]GLW85321.1 GNAT family N-acetyltransferase [Actinokineospora globicatena]